MPRVLRILPALAVTALAAGTGFANSTILGIFKECKMETYAVTLGADGKGTPQKIFSLELSGGGDQFPRAFHMAPDTRSIVFHQFAGFAVQRTGGSPVETRALVNPRNIFWAPDSKRILYWTGEGLAVADTTDLGEAGGPVKQKFIWKRRPNVLLAGAAWSPDGAHVYVSEHNQEKVGDKLIAKTTSIQKVSITGEAREIHRHPAIAIYFMLPTSRFESGAGASAAPFKLFIGGRDGLWMMSKDGADKERVSDFTPQGVLDVVADPKRDKMIVRLGQNQVSPDKKTTYQGVYLMHFDRWKKGQPLEIEQLYGSNDAHTLWFSATGKYVLWASEGTVAFREPDGKPDSAVTIKIDDRGVLPIKGALFDRSESRVAITVGGRLYVYDLAKKTTTKVASVSEDPAKSFSADPVWRGENEILFTQFSNMQDPRFKPPTPKQGN